MSATAEIGLVVLIDDNDIDLFVQKRLIEINNFAKQVITFRSPLDALAFFQKADDLPEIILLDLNMPVIDGFEFLDKYMELPEKITSCSKVVVLTSSGSMTDRERVHTYPCVIGFVSKPMETKILNYIRDQFAALSKKVAHSEVEKK